MLLNFTSIDANCYLLINTWAGASVITFSAGGWWMCGWVVGVEIEIITKLSPAKLESELGPSLAKSFYFYHVLLFCKPLCEGALIGTG